MNVGAQRQLLEDAALRASACFAVAELRPSNPERFLL
jgi:hypothetical protein